LLDLLTSNETAKLLRRHPATLARWRKLGRGPNAIPVEGAWLYDRQSVASYLARLNDAGERIHQQCRDIDGQRTRDELANRLRQGRLNGGLTQAALSQKAEIPLWRIRDIEHGLSIPREHEVSAWAYACGAGDQEAELLTMLKERAPGLTYSARLI
jgi:hypothetical protein